MAGRQGARGRRIAAHLLWRSRGVLPFARYRKGSRRRAPHPAQHGGARFVPCSLLQALNVRAARRRATSWDERPYPELREGRTLGSLDDRGVRRGTVRRYLPGSGARSVLGPFAPLPGLRRRASRGGPAVAVAALAVRRVRSMLGVGARSPARCRYIDVPRLREPHEIRVHLAARRALSHLHGWQPSGRRNLAKAHFQGFADLP